MRRALGTTIALVGGLALSAFMVPQAAISSEPDGPPTITTTLTLHNDDGTSSVTTEVIPLVSVTDMETGEVRSVSSSDQMSTSASNPQGAYLACGEYYEFENENNSYTIQHACRSSTAPWSITVKPAVCSIVQGNMSESGMSWTRNGATMPRQAPHSEPCGYLIHGTYNPALDTDSITYSDIFTFRHAQGSGELEVWGSFTLSDSPG